MKPVYAIQMSGVYYARHGGWSYDYPKLWVKRHDVERKKLALKKQLPNRDVTIVTFELKEIK